MRNSWCSKRGLDVLCIVKCVNLKEDTIKILGIHYSCNKVIENEENFRKHKGWECPKVMETKEFNFRKENNYFRNFIFIQNDWLCSSQKIPNEIIDQLSKMQKDFILNNMKPETKKSTLHNNFQDGGLKSFDIK